jgi:hypothetical protein
MNRSVRRALIGVAAGGLASVALAKLWELEKSS